MFPCPALYSTFPSRGLIKLYIFCKGWRHRCDISANKPLFPPPLSLCQITNCTAASFENGKEVRAKMDSSMEGSARKLSPLNSFSNREWLQIGIVHYLLYAAHVCYLKCVRCLWMSRSRMGVGLEEPRGERSWLNKSWNSLQICLTDRRKEGMRVYHLSPTQPSQYVCIFFFSCMHPHYFGSTHTQIQIYMQEQEKFNVNPKTRTTLSLHMAKDFANVNSELDFNVSPGCVFGFHLASYLEKEWELFPCSTFSA